MEQYKTCTKCKQTKTSIDFHKDKSRLDGLFPQCKKCVNSRMQKYCQDNAEANRRRASDWYKKNALRAAQTRKIWRAKNPQYMINYLKEYRQANRQTMKDYLAKYYAENPEKFQAYNAKRRLRQQSTFFIAKKEIAKLLAKPCLYCGQPSKHIDHIVPLARGGRHSIGNLTGACKTCNLSKGAKFLMEWKRDKGTK